MSFEITLEHVRRAWDTRDPSLVDLVDQLSRQEDPEPETPIRDGALTFDRFLWEINSQRFRQKPAEEQQHFRVETMKALEADDAEVPLPDRLKLHEVIMSLWHDNGHFARTCLLKIIARVNLTYGPWRALKRIFKEAEANGDTEIYGALAARFDMAFASRDANVSRLTLGYLCRRAWRFLRHAGQSLPACYADMATDFLANYQDGTNWPNTWIVNHIFFHDSGMYSASRFQFYYEWPSDMLSQRAFADLWQRSPRPLFSLLERAQADQIREFACEALKNDFRAVLREVEPEWVSRLVRVDSQVIDRFIVWILDNVPRFEQAAFRELGLHDTVLKLFDSQLADARVYAAKYARTHARDLPVDMLIRLANNRSDEVRELASDLLLERDARTKIGLEAWGKLLETEFGHKLAVKVLRENFGAQELTPAWFKSRILSRSERTFSFAIDLLPKIHPLDQLETTFFCDLIDEAEGDNGANVIQWAAGQLARGDINQLDGEFVQRNLVHPIASKSVLEWVDEGRLQLKTVPIDFLKSLAYHPLWETNEWIGNLRQSDRWWANNVHFDEPRSEQILAWLADPRHFSARDLEIPWLLELAQRAEPQYHDFAVDVMVRGLAPADFADGPDANAGCQRVWEMATGGTNGDEPLVRFALRYLRRHHAEMYQDATGQTLEPNMRVPTEFLSLAQVKPLFFDTRLPLRQFALELAKFEFARWSPSIEALVELCEAPHDEVREFVATALTCDEKPEHRRYRLDPAVLTPDTVYSFCEAREGATRMLGMKLIEMHARLQLPEELFRLTESPDRKVRAFAIRTIWSLYRHRGITEDWKPHIPQQTTVGEAARKKADELAKRLGDGAPARPEELPATHPGLNEFLRRVLFEIPPAKLEKTKGITDTIRTRLKPLPARKAKLSLIEVVRDLAIEDAEFARVILPLLEEFMGSRGESEQKACLVAVTRVRKAQVT